MEQVNKGRKMVIVLIVTFLLIDCITTAILSSIYKQIGATELASYKLLQGIFRFILTCILFIFLYKGYKWSKWICIILFLGGGILSFFSLLSEFNLIMLIIVLLYFLIVLGLIASKSVNIFFDYQRGRFVPDIKKMIDDLDAAQHSPK